ncbi:MAG TPA: ABC transporter permease [Roseiarcus sp.]|nr:ABC transporter permease [Roseiarcus sp.]
MNAPQPPDRSGDRRQDEEELAVSRLRRDMPLVPASSIAGRALVSVIAIMTFLSCLTAGGAMLVASASQGWRSQISREVTIQIKPDAGREIDAQVEKAAATARAAPGVANVQVFSKQDSERLLEPWLGAGLDLSELPIPRLIVVRMQDRVEPDLSALRSALATQAPGASLDDHRLWLARLDTMADAIVLFALALFLLMISAMMLAIGFATRGAMAGNREIIEVLHFVGAADSYISRQFQGHFLRLGLRGGLLGGAGAALFFLAATALSAWWSNSPGGEEIVALFGAFALGLKGYVAIFAVAVAIGVLTAAMSRIIVFRHLRRLL